MNQIKTFGCVTLINGDCMEYMADLKDPRWKEFANEVKEHYQNRCNGCGNNSKLNAHHKKYYFDREIWEYDLLETEGF